MAEWLPIVQVDITLNTTGSTREGFGLPLFIANTDVFPERVRTYSSMTDLAADFPDATSAVNKAATKLWAQTPKVTSLSVARRDMQYLLSIPAAPTSGQTYTVTLFGANGTSSQRSVQSAAGDDQEAVLNKLKTQIAADPTFGSITTTTSSGSGSTAKLLVTATNPAVNFLRVTSNALITNQSSPSDDPATFLKNIMEYDNTWYFVAIEDRQPATVTEFANQIAAQTSRKLFFTATDISTALSGTVLANATDWVAALAQQKSPRVAVLWHHTAASDYPEMAYIGYGAPYDAGSITWSNAQLAGVAYSMQPQTLNVVDGVTTGRPLNSGQKAALETRNCNYVDYDGGVSCVRHGKLSSGEWIDVVHGTDWLQSDLTTSLRDLLINQKGGKVTYDDRGITRVRQVIESSLERAVGRNLLSSYKVKVPRASQISTELKRQRLLKDMSFTGILAGAINDVNLQGTVSYD